jgi:hypothetical protein
MGLFHERCMAGEAEVATRLGELELLWPYVRVVAGGAIALSHGAVNTFLVGKGCLLFLVAGIAELGPLVAYELGELRRMGIVAARARAPLDGGMDVAPGEFLFQLVMALETELSPLRLELYRRVRWRREEQTYRQ